MFASKLRRWERTGFPASIFLHLVEEENPRHTGIVAPLNWEGRQAVSKDRGQPKPEEEGNSEGLT